MALHPLSGVFDLASGLAPHTTDVTQEAWRKQTIFIAKRLAFSFAALACAPLLLAFRGAPSLAETLAFACALTPLAGAMVVARTGRLVVAHAIVVLGLAGLGMTLWLGLGCGAVCAATWLLAAHVEARSAGNAMLSRLAAVLTVVLLAFFCALPEARLAATQSNVACLLAVGLAVVYSWVAYFDEPHAGSPRKTGDDETLAWHAIAEALEDPVLVFDATGAVDRIRIGPGQQLSLNASDLTGRGFFENVLVGDRPALLKLLTAALQDDATMAATIRLRTRTGAYRQIDLRARRITPEDGSAEAATRVVAILRDADEKHSQEREMEAARLSVEDAARSKHHFIASMSHELRTPLNAIIGFSEMLASHTLRPADAPKQYEYARIINQSGQHLLSVVNAILDMSKINSGTFPIVAEPFDLVPLVELCCDMVALKANEGQVQIERDYADLLETMIGDKRACQQILINLLSNAVKFTPAGGRVSVAVRPEGTGLALTVSDTGIGISAADLARLGDPFFQAGPSLSRTHQGSGLGLSVVRGLVGLQGGSIAIESEPGHGTSVKIHLPQDCRGLNGDTAPATIDTSARRQAPDRIAPRVSDQRMMQVA